jgi:hypothetical protein
MNGFLLERFMWTNKFENERVPTFFIFEKKNGIFTGWLHEQITMMNKNPNKHFSKNAHLRSF